MSEDTPGVINSATAEQSSSPEPQTVPKYRLDEEIAKTKSYEQQLQFAQQMLRQQVPASRPQVVQQEPAYMKKLKEENPEAYMALKVQEKQLKEQSAATFQVIDQQDRQAFLMEFGQEGSARMQEVESKLEQLRARGIHNYNRGDIYTHLEGADAIKSKRTAKQAPKQSHAQSAAAPVTLKEALDAPSSEPRSAGTVNSGSASVGKVAESLEDLERRLENEEF